MGFGGGEKPAIFQAVSPQYQLINQQTDGDDGNSPPPIICHDRIGDTINWALSGLASCGCFLFPLNPGPGAVDASVVFSGLNGIGTAAWDGVSAWIVSGLGSYTVTTYPSSDASCTGTPTGSDSGTVTLTISCFGPTERFGAQMTGSPITLMSAVYAPEFFVGTSFAGPVITSDYTSSAFCGTGTTVASPVIAFGGTITVS